MKRNLLIGLLHLVLALTAPAADFKDANRKFETGDYAGAVASYESVLAKDGPSAAAYYNLGNAYQRLREYGPAILAYERARLLTPRDPDLLANLALARKAATAFEESGGNPQLDAVIQHFSRNEWSWLVAGGALFLGGLALICGSLRFPRPWMPKAAITSAVIAVLTIAISASALYLRRAETTRGIVLSNDATIRLSPFEKAESLGTPGPGRIVQLGGRNGGFQYVEVPGVKLRGWIANDGVAAVYSRTPAAPSPDGNILDSTRSPAE